MIMKVWTIFSFYVTSWHIVGILLILGWDESFYIWTVKRITVVWIVTRISYEWIMGGKRNGCLWFVRFAVGGTSSEKVELRAVLISGRFIEAVRWQTGINDVVIIDPYAHKKYALIITPIILTLGQKRCCCNITSYPLNPPLVTVKNTNNRKSTLYFPKRKVPT